MTFNMVMLKASAMTFNMTPKGFVGLDNTKKLTTTEGASENQEKSQFPDRLHGPSTILQDRLVAFMYLDERANKHLNCSRKMRG